jgi:hypothetical protein
MNNGDIMLANLNNNVNYDLKSSAEFLFEDDNWPNPYLEMQIVSKFFDNDSLIRTYCNSSQPLFLSINIQSLMSKFDQLKDFVLTLLKNNVKIVAIALQEIWSVPYPELVNIPGFKFVYKLRTSGRGGGVGFYVNDDFQFSVLNVVPFVESQFENIVLETVVDSKKYYLCNIYRAPHSPTNESLRDLIENFNSRLEVLMNHTNKPHYNSLIFMDSNINLLKLNYSQLSAEFLDTCHASGFIISNFKATRICNESYSLIL